MRNPHLRAKLAETLEALVPVQKSQKSAGLLSVSPVNMVIINYYLYHHWHWMPTLVYLRVNYLLVLFFKSLSHTLVTILIQALALLTRLIHLLTLLIYFLFNMINSAITILRLTLIILLTILCINYLQYNTITYASNNTDTYTTYSTILQYCAKVMQMIIDDYLAVV